MANISNIDIDIILLNAKNELIVALNSELDKKNSEYQQIIKYSINTISKNKLVIKLNDNSIRPLFNIMDFTPSLYTSLAKLKVQSIMSNVKDNILYKICDMITTNSMDYKYLKKILFDISSNTYIIAFDKN